MSTPGTITVDICCYCDRVLIANGLVMTRIFSDVHRSRMVWCDWACFSKDFDQGRVTE